MIKDLLKHDVQAVLRDIGQLLQLLAAAISSKHNLDASLPSLPHPSLPAWIPHRSHDCTTVEASSGQRQTIVPGCMGTGCKANGVDRDGPTPSPSPKPSPHPSPPVPVHRGACRAAIGDLKVFTEIFRDGPLGVPKHLKKNLLEADEAMINEMEDMGKYCTFRHANAGKCGESLGSITRLLFVGLEKSEVMV